MAPGVLVFPRPHDHVPVIFHQPIGQKPGAGASHGLLKHRLERDEVLKIGIRAFERFSS
jgi:hypothetical protein